MSVLRHLHATRGVAPMSLEAAVAFTGRRSRLTWRDKILNRGYSQRQGRAEWFRERR